MIIYCRSNTISDSHELSSRWFSPSGSWELQYCRNYSKTTRSGLGSIASIADEDKVVFLSTFLNIYCFSHHHFCQVSSLQLVHVSAGMSAGVRATSCPEEKEALPVFWPWCADGRLNPCGLNPWPHLAHSFFFIPKSKKKQSDDEGLPVPPQAQWRKLHVIQEEM